MPPPSLGREMAAYTKPAILGAIESGATPISLGSRFAAAGAKPATACMRGGQNTLPPGHPDRERAQAIIDSLPQHNPARDRALGDPCRIAARTVVGIADGAGGTVVGKTLAGPWEGDLPRAETQALMEAMRQQAAQKALTRHRRACPHCQPTPTTGSLPCAVPREPLPAPRPAVGHVSR
jgi:hypothetical protein